MFPQCAPWYIRKTAIARMFYRTNIVRRRKQHNHRKKNKSMPIFDGGIKLLLVASQTPLEVNPGFPVHYLHFKDSTGATIVPTYERDGLRTSVGPFSGAAITIVSTTELQTLNDRATALEAKRLTVTSLKTANYTAASWQHVLVDMDAASGDVTITMPASPATNDRVQVTDISVDGGYGNGRTLKVACPFAAASGGNWAGSSPFSVAYSSGLGGSLKGASIELVYIGTGWIIASETCSVAELL